MKNLSERLVEIKHNVSYKSKFIHGTYVWNYDLVNPNSKGNDLYSSDIKEQNKVIKRSIKNSKNITKYLEDNYKFKKFNKTFKDKFKNAGLLFDINYGWHTTVEMPKDNNGNLLPWFDYDNRLDNLKDNKDVFEEIMKNIVNNILPEDLNKDIKVLPEIINAGSKAISFCYGRLAFRNMSTKAFENLGITIIMLGPGSHRAFSGDFAPIDEKYDVIITFRNKKTYGELTERFISQCKKLKINYYVEIYDAKDGNYQDLINYKPNFIHNTIEKFKDFPVLYTDADMYIVRYPEIFDQTYFDCMLYNWYSQVSDFYVDYLDEKPMCFNNFKPRASGGTMWWGTSIQSKNALKIWDIISKNNPGKSDDRVLDIVFNSTSAMANLKCYWLPSEYIYITDKLNGFGAHLKKRWYVGEPIIIHPEDITSEEMAGSIASLANREPADYFFNKSRGPNFDFLSERTSKPTDTKFKCFQNYDIENKKNVFKPFKYHEEDENLIFKNLDNNTTLFDSLRLRSKKTSEIFICDHIEYNFNYKIYNRKFTNEFIKLYKIIYNPKTSVIFTIYTDNQKLYNDISNEFNKIKKLINPEFGFVFVLLDKKCKRPLLTSTKFTLAHLEKHNINSENIKILPIIANSFNKDIDIFKVPASDESHNPEFSNKFHTMNLNVVLTNSKSDIITVNYNSIMNITNDCYDYNTLNIVPYSILSLKNTHNIKYFIDKCINEFDNITKKEINKFTEFRIIDNVYNVNMLSLYWAYEWLPEEYILGIIYCEDYTCYSEEIDDFYQFKTEGNTPEINKWSKIQNKLKECYKTHIPSSSLYINFTKNFPVDFMIDFNEKYKIGKSPKDKEEIKVTKSFSTYELKEKKEENKAKSEDIGEPKITTKEKNKIIYSIDENKSDDDVIIKLNKNTYDKVNKLMIVAHPDDEMLWGGANLLLDNGWHVIVCTHGNEDNSRYLELSNSIKYAGVFKWEAFNIKDEYTEDQELADATFMNKSSPLYKHLLKLSKQKWDLVLTHNNKGEYGHAHHIAVHNLVKSLFKNSQFFQVNKKLNKKLLDRKKDLCKYYADTQKICTHIYDNNNKVLKKVEKDHYENEKIYVNENNRITKVIHQIWFGNKAPKWRQYMFDEVKKMAIKNGYEYKLWTMDDFKKENLSITWDHINEVLEIGVDQDHNRWAQVADLARYDILFKYGGIYLDSLFQVKNKFFNEMNKLIDKYEFIVCNEEPVGLKEKWISNGFFACAQKNDALYSILKRDMLNKIDLKSPIITKSTGPWYFRKALNNIEKQKLFIIDSELIYPFLTHKGTFKRKTEINKCLTKFDNKLKNKIIEVNKKNNMYLYKSQYCEEFYPDSWVIYQSGLGGTWSY